MSVALVTGSAGLIGSQMVEFLCDKGYEVVGVDNDMRSYFFGAEASTSWRVGELQKLKGYTHLGADIRDEAAIDKIVKSRPFDFVIHTAAQPSHDWAAKEPLTDFTINATGTLVMLKAVQAHCPDATFIFTSTNKVYGDTPNALPLVEEETRWEIAPDHPFNRGIDESMSIDRSMHSIFGASKVAADILTQEYGHYFGMKTAVFRCGCLTGPYHSGAELHGFLAYLAKCVATGRKYSIFGYKGKQVRDNIHSWDLVNAFWHFHQNPRSAEVYNMGGGRFASISMMEAIKGFEKLFGREAVVEYLPENRRGDHIWYISDVGKFQSHYPEWKYKYDMDATMDQIAASGHL